VRGLETPGKASPPRMEPAPSAATAPAAAKPEAQPRTIALPFGLPALRVPLNVDQRMRDWTMYASGIGESARTAVFGHRKPMDRAVSTSAHNYYLDLAYNFGFLALVPFAALAAATAIRLRRARPLDLPLLGLAFVVAFFVLADSNFKVTFRQPYPGLFAFFLWGVLLARLSERKAV
jgi:hypothetical protein